MTDYPHNNNILKDYNIGDQTIYHEKCNYNVAYILPS